MGTNISKPKYALVLVHGQGEQRYMEMAGRFVEHVFKANFDPSLSELNKGPTVRSVSEAQSGLEDSRRYEVRFEDDRPDYDVFEFYWSPKMSGNSLQHFVMWFFSFLKRDSAEIPMRTRGVKRAITFCIWLLLIFSAFYLYATAGTLFPVQLVQIAQHGWQDFWQFSLDWRFVGFSGAVILFLSAVGCALFKRFEWCLGFCALMMALCATFPLLLDVPERVRRDIDFLYENSDKPNFNIWGSPGEYSSSDIDDGKIVSTASETLLLASRISLFLCGRDASNIPKGLGDDFAKARWAIDVATEKPLSWGDLEQKRGVQLKDACLAPVALASPVVFARVADSAHILLTGIMALVALLLFCAWKLFLRSFLVDIMGDSARYLNNHPLNNLHRQEIRASGVGMIDALHKSKRYDRIFVVAHSLGSIVSFDVLRQYWSQVAKDGVAVHALEANRLRTAAGDLVKNPGNANAQGEWQMAQLRLFANLSDAWKISDFITLGSPLAHGRLLLEGSVSTVHSSERFLTQRDITQAIPACPPVGLQSGGATLAPKDLFAVVRWTNIYFEDDPVGGSVSEDADGLLFGRGIRDVAFSAKKLKAPGISHNSYWMSSQKLDRNTSVPWLDELAKLLCVEARPSQPSSNG